MEVNSKKKKRKKRRANEKERKGGRETREKKTREILKTRVRDLCQVFLGGRVFGGVQVFF